MSIAKNIDHTVLKPNTTLADIQKVCNEAKEYFFAAVCIPPYFVSNAYAILENSDIKIATVIGFPFGYNHHTAKFKEVEKAVAEGANEIDMVMNIAAFKNDDYDYIKEEVQTVLQAVSKTNIVLKVIIETGLLSDEEIVECCDLYKNYPVNFLKTSTGYAEKGASLDTVSLMRKHLPGHIKIKASGGIKTFEFANALLNAGASRLGCSASVAIVNGEKAVESGY